MRGGSPTPPQKNAMKKTLRHKKKFIILDDIDIINDCIQIKVKNNQNRIFQIKFDEVIIFQKVSIPLYETKTINTPFLTASCSIFL